MEGSVEYLGVDFKLKSMTWGEGMKPSCEFIGTRRTVEDVW